MRMFVLHALISTTGPEWYEDHTVSAHDALKLLVNRIQHMGPVSKYERSLVFLGLCNLLCQSKVLSGWGKLECVS